MLKLAIAGHSGIFNTNINKFTDKGRYKVNMMAFLKNFKSSVAILP